MREHARRRARRSDGRGGRTVAGEVVGFRGDRALCLPFGPLEGVAPGLPRRVVADADGGAARRRPGSAASSTPSASRSTARGRCPPGRAPIRCAPRRRRRMPARRVGEPLDLGVRALNTFTTCCRGQRMGIFAGSGVGKSVLLSMLARNAACDVVVIGLIGERGREVQEFIEDDLGEEGLARAVVVVATSDEPALMRRQAAYLTLAVAEYFRDQGARGALPDGQRHPLRHGAARDRPGRRRAADHQGLHADRLRRAAAAAGARRARRRRRRAPITGLFTVLVDGDDHNEPIADAVRGILDGHIVMERAHRRARPLSRRSMCCKSISRTMPGCVRSRTTAARAAARAQADGGLRRHGGADPPRRLPQGHRPGGRRGDRRSTAPLEAFLAPGQGRESTIA